MERNGIETAEHHRSSGKCHLLKLVSATRIFSQLTWDSRASETTHNTHARRSTAPAPDLMPLAPSRTLHGKHNHEGFDAASVAGWAPAQTHQCPGQAVCSRFKHCPTQLGSKCKKWLFYALDSVGENQNNLKATVFRFMKAVSGLEGTLGGIKWKL